LASIFLIFICFYRKIIQKALFKTPEFKCSHSQADTISAPGVQLICTPPFLVIFIQSSHEKIPSFDIGNTVGYMPCGDIHTCLYELLSQKAFAC
jgi:hypothetical protein